MRFPSTFCCPKQEIINEMFKSLPFDPALTMVTKRLSLSKLLRPILPDSEVAWLRMLLTCVSNSSSFVFPVLFSKTPICVWSIRFFTSFFFLSMTAIISLLVFSSDSKSLMPTLKELVFKYSVTMFCKSSMKSAEAILP